MNFCVKYLTSAVLRINFVANFRYAAYRRAVIYLDLLRPTRSQRYPYIHIQLTAGVALRRWYCLLLGLIALLGIGAHTVTDDIRSSVGLDVVLSDSVKTSEVKRALKQVLTSSPYSLSVAYRSSGRRLVARWQQDTGEDLMEVAWRESV